MQLTPFLPLIPVAIFAFIDSKPLTNKYIKEESQKCTCLEPIDSVPEEIEFQNYQTFKETPKIEIPVTFNEVVPIEEMIDQELYQKARIIVKYFGGNPELINAFVQSCESWFKKSCTRTEAFLIILQFA